MVFEIFQICTKNARLEGTRTQLAGGEERGRSPCLFLKMEKKCPEFEKNYPDCDHLSVKFLDQNNVLRVSRKKKFQTFWPYLHVL